MLARPRLCLTLFCLACWLPGFVSLPPGDRDESRFAQATKQMLETGDFVRISNGGEARNRKPIGIHWLQVPFAAAARAVGVGAIWPYRVPSLLGGLVAVLGTFELGLLLTGKRAALLAGAMLAGSLLLCTEVHIAKTDAALLGATVVAMAVLARGYLAPERVGPGAAAAFWLAMAAGILIKGPVLPMVAVLSVLALWAADRRASWLGCLRTGWGAPLLLLAVLPWFVAIGVATHGAFYRQSVGGDLAGKLAGGDDAHGAPPGLHLLLLPLLALPAGVAMLRALPDSWADRRSGSTRFLLAWLVPSWLVFELVPTKLPHYVLPLYPPLCVLGARFVAERGRLAPGWLRRLSDAGFALACVVLALALAALPVVVGGAWWLGVPAALAVGVVGYAVLGRERRRGVVLGVALMPLVTWAALGLELPALSPLWIAPRVEAALKADWPGWNARGEGFGTVGFREPSLMFLAGTRMAVLASPAEGAAALSSGRITALLIDRRDRAAFEAAAARDGIAPRLAEALSGVNYSRGQRVGLDLYVR